MRVITSIVMLAIMLLALQSCGLKEDISFTLVCTGKNEVLAKIKDKPALAETRDENRTYEFEMRDLKDYHCHTWRQEKIACIRSVDDEKNFQHESVTIHRAAMSVIHTAVIEKKKTGLVQEESFEGKCKVIKGS